MPKHTGAEFLQKNIALVYRKGTRLTFLDLRKVLFLYFAFCGVKKTAATLNEHGESIVGRGPWKSCLFLLTSFSLREQSGASLIARSKRPWNQIIWRDGCMLGKADQLFFGLSGAPRTALENPWERVFLLFERQKLFRFYVLFFTKEVRSY